MKFCRNCEILSKLWNLVKIVKCCKNCEIWSKLWNLVEIVKFGRKPFWVIFLHPHLSYTFFLTIYTFLVNIYTPYMYYLCNLTLFEKFLLHLYLLIESFARWSSTILPRQNKVAKLRRHTGRVYFASDSFCPVPRLGK